LTLAPISVAPSKSQVPTKKLHGGMTFRGRVDVDGDDGVHAQQPCAKKPF